MGRYSVPKSVRQHIDYITPGVKWLEVAPQDAKTKRSLQGGRQAPVSRPIDEPIEHVQAADASLSQCDKYITPNCIKGEPEPIRSPAQSLLMGI